MGFFLSPALDTDPIKCVETERFPTPSSTSAVPSDREQAALEKTNIYSSNGSWHGPASCGWRLVPPRMDTDGDKPMSPQIPAMGQDDVNDGDSMFQGPLVPRPSAYTPPGQ